MVCPVFTYEDMKYLVIHKWNLCNTLVLRLEKYVVLCEQSGSRSGGSRDKWLVTVCSVCFRRSYTSGTCAYARGWPLICLENKADPD